MNAALPTGTRGQVLAVAITVVLLAALWLGVAAPLLSWHGERADRLRQRQALAERMEMLAARLPELRREAANVASGPPPQTLLEGASDAVSGAQLQERLQTMAATAGAPINSAETLPAENRGAYRRIGLRLAVNAPYAALIRLLQSVEEATPRMLIDDVQVQSAPIVLDRSAPTLDASFSVYAFRAGTGASK